MCLTVQRSRKSVRKGDVMNGANQDAGAMYGKLRANMFQDDIYEQLRRGAADFGEQYYMVTPWDYILKQGIRVMLMFFICIFACHNILSASDETSIAKLYNPLLAEKCRMRDIVPSAVKFGENERIYILTGPNSGGKTVYITAVGLAQIMFQLGLPVCALSAEIKPYRKILTHFIMPTVKQSESRLVNETLRMKESLEQVTESTLILLDETFSSTSAYDAMLLAEALIKYLAKIGCSAVYVTHLLDLNDKVRELTDDSGIRMLCAAVENGKRTYEIVPHKGEESVSSMAREIAENSGLGFLFDA